MFIPIQVASFITALVIAWSIIFFVGTTLGIVIAVPVFINHLFQWIKGVCDESGTA
ncbi:MAG TPA: hypothetical protein PLL17_02430 [Defluviitaleaceae bacterium]|nr:hypothetical protein [Defluviitaleaceae bacterium]